MRNFATALAVAALLVSPTACKKSKDDKTEKPAPAPSVGKTTTATPTPTEKPKPPTRTEIPMTTSSSEAKKALTEALELWDLLRNKEASDKLKRALELDPNFVLAQAYAASSQPSPDREDKLANATKMAKGLPEIEQLFITAQIAGARGDISGARAAWDALGEKAPGVLRVQLDRGAFFGGLDELDKAEAALEAAVKLDPTYAPTYNIICFIYERRGQLDKAVAAAEKQVELSPKEPNPLDTLAWFRIRSGDFAAAEKTYSEVLKLDPSFNFARTGLAVSHIYRGDTKAAAAILAKAVEKSQQPFEKWNHQHELVALSLLEGNRNEVLKQVDKAAPTVASLGFDPVIAKSLPKSNYLLLLGDPKQGKKELEKALAAITDKKPVGMRMTAYRNGLDIAAELGDKSFASAMFEKHEAIAKTGPAHFYARGQLEAAHGQTDKALASLSKHSADVPQNLYAMLRVLERAKRTKEADAMRAKLATAYRANVQDAVLAHLAKRVPSAK